MNVSKLKTFNKLFYRSMMTKKWWLLVIITSMLFMMGGCAAVLATTTIYNLDSLKNLKFATTIYDHNQKPVEPLGGSQREYVDLDDVKSDLLAKTFVGVEDERFYKHNGADLKGLGRALAVDLMTMSSAEGGSTITMQVARNVILNNNEKTFWRKLSEIAIAYNLERKYTKKQILESYLNYIYLGNNVRGIKMAAKIYFDKDITKEKLEPHEIALLAGMPKAPEGYNPYVHPERAKERRNVVLAKMAELGYISNKEKEEYQQKPLGVNRKYMAKYLKDDKYQAYTQYVIQEAANRYGLKSEELASGGYKIYTGLNTKAQNSLEKALKDSSFYKGHEKLDGGATVIDPKTGAIAALGGGRQYLPGYENRALSRIQPGSSIKPLTVYAPAVQEKGYNENSIVSDTPYSIGSWSPKNYDKTYHGNVPLKEVAGKSMNVATVRLLNDVVGVNTAYDYAQKLGLDLEPADKQPAPLALGGLTRGVSTVQMAQAYSSFLRDGKVSDAHAIIKIVDADGDEVEPIKKIKTDQPVYSPDTAWTMTKILKYAVQNGTGKNAQLADGRDVAGKTGTTQNSKESWFVGYTPEYVMAVTVFNEQGSQVELSGGEYPARIFNQVMSDTLSGTQVSHFQPPGGNNQDDGFNWFGSDEPEQPEQPATPPPVEKPKEEKEEKKEKEPKREEPTEPQEPAEPPVIEDPAGGDQDGGDITEPPDSNGGDTTGGSDTGNTDSGNNTTSPPPPSDDGDSTAPQQ
ncbi:penicillin-binding protein 1F [Marinithermofilum abyssi]|uniref:Penicillin-binding protein 1F n=1 Tax=Marinithermofilum abyssi TaxID=1571185 RepID=A0A8J2VII6_9BACL|nr:PBP1A family penicillin-binding protein [Marinithermofilum abyssi]GGE23829.1 penicillin-binding protein 1F [Marinithermofilum abyssi]